MEAAVNPPHDRYSPLFHITEWPCCTYCGPKSHRQYLKEDERHHHNVNI